MNIKKLLMKAARKPQHKKEVRNMSLQKAHRILTDMELSFAPLSDEQKEAVEVIKSHKEEK